MSLKTDPAETDTCILIGRMLAKVTDKWTMTIIRMLGRGPRRFNALRRAVGDISQKVLASTLRDLEQNGLVLRTVSLTTPPMVEYALTELGGEFLVPVRALASWIFDNNDRIVAARNEFLARLGQQQTTIEVEPCAPPDGTAPVSSG